MYFILVDPHTQIPKIPKYPNAPNKHLTIFCTEFSRIVFGSFIDMFYGLSLEDIAQRCVGNHKCNVSNEFEETVQQITYLLTH